MPAPKHLYSLIFIYIYRLYIDTYFIYLSVYDGDIQGKTKLMYKNSVSCSLSDKQHEPRSSQLLTLSRRLQSSFIETWRLHEAFREPYDSILNMRKEMPENGFTNVPVYSTKCSIFIFDVFTIE